MLVVLPLFVGNAVRAAGWMVMFGSRGLLNTLAGGGGLIDRPLQLMYTEAAVIVGITAVNLPFMVLTLESVIEGIDPAIEEAAASLGARPLQVFRRVILPLAMPGVLAGTILVFILGMNAYATPILLGGPRFQMMGPLVYGQFAGQNNWPFGAALVVHLNVSDSHAERGLERPRPAPISPLGEAAEKGAATSLATSALPAAYAAYASVGPQPPPRICTLLGSLTGGCPPDPLLAGDY